MQYSKTSLSKLSKWTKITHLKQALEKLQLVRKVTVAQFLQQQIWNLVETTFLTRKVEDQVQYQVETHLSLREHQLLKICLIWNQLHKMTLLQMWKLWYNKNNVRMIPWKKIRKKLQEMSLISTLEWSALWEVILNSKRREFKLNNLVLRMLTSLLVIKLVMLLKLLRPILACFQFHKKGLIPLKLLLLLQQTILLEHQCQALRVNNQLR